MGWHQYTPSSNSTTLESNKSVSAIPARARVPEEDTMKLGTSLRFLYPTGPHTYERFKEVLAALPPGGFIERPMGAFETDVQAAQVLEVAAAAHAAGLSFSALPST